MDDFVLLGEELAKSLLPNGFPNFEAANTEPKRENFR